MNRLSLKIRRLSNGFHSNALALAALVVVSTATWAQPPETINQSGRLAFANSGRLVEGIQTMTFRLYAAENAITNQAVWEEQHEIFFTRGFYTVVLGNQTDLAPVLETQPELFLGIQVNDGAELSPRAAVSSVPFAIRAIDVTGDINPVSVSIAGETVIDDSGAWVGDPTGLVGPQGETGPTGPAGDDGAAGPQGATGPTGNDGAPGPAGPQGATGPAGNDGAPGPAGPQGATGPAGNDGAPGPAGPQGATGPAGNDGAAGPAGPQGATGPAGNNGAPGPAGPQGATGPAGNDGATGPAGPQGATGPAGSDGATGPAGPQGATGPAGPQGATGPAGSDGAPGPAGPQGATGPAGNDGAPGPAGPQGATGPSGNDGAPGPMGPPGMFIGTATRVAGTAQISAVNAAAGTVLTGSASCAPGKPLLSGGAQIEFIGNTPASQAGHAAVASNYPLTGEETWSASAVVIVNLSGNHMVRLTPWALCAP